MPKILWENFYAYVADKPCIHCTCYKLHTDEPRYLVLKPSGEERLKLDLDAALVKTHVKILRTQIYSRDTRWEFMVDLVSSKRGMDIYRAVVEALQKLGVDDWHDMKINEIESYGAEMIFQFRPDSVKSC